MSVAQSSSNETGRDSQTRITPVGHKSKSSVFKHVVYSGGEKDPAENQGKGPWKCKHCGISVPGSDNPTRVCAHFITCKNIPASDLAVLSKQHSSIFGRVIFSPSSDNSQSSSSSSLTNREDCRLVESRRRVLTSEASSTTEPVKKVFRQSSIKSSTVSISRPAWDAFVRHFVKAMYQCNVPFRFIENEQLKFAFDSLGVTSRSESFPALPTRRAVAGPLLNEMYQECKSTFADACLKARWLSVSTDSWTNAVDAAVVNFIVHTPAPLFFDSVFTGDHNQDAEYLADVIHAKMREITEHACGGVDKWSAIVTDNCNTMKKAWRLLKQKMPKLATIGCAAHITHLLLKDICRELPWLAASIDFCNDLTSFFSRKKLLWTRIETQCGARKRLQASVSTRWASQHTCIASVIANEDALRQAAARAEMQVDLGHRAASLVRNSFWQELRKAECFLREFAIVIAFLESDVSVLSDAFVLWDHLNLHCASVLSAEDAAGAETKLLQRWKAYLHRPEIVAAVFLDPRFHRMYFDSSVVDEGVSYCNSQIDEASRNDLGNELAMWVVGSVAFNYALCTVNGRVCPRAFWNGVGLMRFPKLSQIAMRLFEIPVTSAAAERNFSTHGRTLTKLRNRMHNETQRKLVTVQEAMRRPEEIGTQRKSLGQACMDKLSEEGIRIAQGPRLPLPQRRALLLQNIGNAPPMFENGDALDEVPFVNPFVSEEDEDGDDDDDGEEEEDDDDNGDRNGFELLIVPAMMPI
eukprot:ANDGO_02755.mRNA.1 hypothetical protein H257_17606